MKDKIEQLIDQLTIEEKVAQMMVLGLTGTFVEPELKEFIEKYGLGGLRLSPHLARKFIRYLPEGSPGVANVKRKPSFREKNFSNNIPPVRLSAVEYAKILNELKKTAFERNGYGLPLHMVADYEHSGGDFTPPGMLALPSPMGFGHLGDYDLIRRSSKALAKQIKAIGIDWIHSPVVDVNVNPANPEIYIRSYNENTEIVINCARAAIQGFRDAGLIGCMKHYPGRGETAIDAHYAVSDIPLDKEHMMKYHIKPYKVLSDENNMPSVMPAHSAYSKLDTSGEIATVSKKIIQGILRDEIGFDGVITTDSMTMGGLMAKYSVGEACILAVEAGVDLLLLKDENVLRYELHEALCEAVNSGRISEERINQSLRRIWKLKSEYGLFDTGGIVDTTKIESVLHDKAIHQVGREAASRVINIKRDDNKILPLKKDQNVLIVDRIIFSQKSRNDSWNHPVMLWQFMLEKSSNIAYVDYEPESREYALDIAKELLDQTDVIVVTADFDRNDKDHSDKKFLNQLRELGKPVVMISSNPYEELLIPTEMETVIVSYGLMHESLKAVAGILYGEEV